MLVARPLPNPGFDGPIANALSFRAWDQTSGSNGSNSDTRTNGNPSAFSSAIDTASLSIHQTTVDFNQDGQTDILWRNQFTGQNVVWNMNGTTILGTSELLSVPIETGWNAVGVADFTQNGRPDILWRNRLNGRNVVWEMDGPRLTQSLELEPVPPASGWKIGGVGDFTRDGNPDLLWQNSFSGQVSLWEMNRTTLVRGREIAVVPPGSGWNIVR